MAVTLRLAFVFLVCVGVVLRLIIGLHPHSGAGTPPIYGDFEAQRHWLEITTRLPVAEWYRNTTDNDLLYWGLDYPPLTAIHSWALGKVAEAVHPSMVALHSSRGDESAPTILFMRWSVIASDFLVFIPAVYLLVVALHKDSFMWRQVCAAALLLMAPPLLQIDHGHFQYNSVALGLMMLCVAAFTAGRDELGVVCIASSVMFKQMSLYFTPAVVFYLLGKHLRSLKGFTRLVGIVVCGLVGLATPLMLMYTLGDGVSSVADVVSRMFPFNRGLFEDKVANVWCSVSVVFKASALPRHSLLMMCTGLTALGFAPAMKAVASRPHPVVFLHALAASSLSFFLFSFQVHEKSILMPMIPCLALAFTPCNMQRFALALPPRALGWDDVTVLMLHFQTVCTFSMFYLALTDKQLLLHMCMMAVCSVLELAALLGTKVGRRTKAMITVSFIGMAALYTLHALWTPPAHLPDVVKLLFAQFSCAHFVLFLCFHSYMALAVTIVGEAKKKLKTA